LALNFSLIIFEALLLAAGALFLHARSRKYGLGLLLFYLAGLATLLQAISPLNLHVALGETPLLVSSVTLVPVILMTLLVLYEVEGTAAARLAIVGIIGVSLLVLLVQLGYHAHQSLPGGPETGPVLPASFRFSRAWPRTMASVLAFSGSLLAIVIVHQALALKARVLPSWMAPGLALLAALLVDDLIFNTLTFGLDSRTVAVTGGTLAKLAGGFLIWPLVAFYLHRIAPMLEGYRGLSDRRPLEVLFGSYRSQETALQTTMEERRKAEEALRASELRFRTTFEQVGVGLAHIGLEGHFFRVNAALCRILRCSEEELRTLNWQDVTASDPPSEGQKPFHELRTGRGDLSESDRVLLRRDGTPVSCLVNASLVRDEEGSPQYFVAAVEDITERNATEAHLRQAQKMEAVGQLTGGIAHDFNNLLTVIMGGIQLGLDGEDGEALEEAMRAARRGAELTHRLLAFSRKQSLKPVSLDPWELLRSMEDLLTRTLGETVRVRLERGGAVGHCLADPGQMENAVLNLALNARDAMPGGGEIRIATDTYGVVQEGDPVPEATQGEYARISVIDQGTGIPPGDMAKIFDPFFTTKAPGKGSGLGLSMVYGFARQSGGFVTVESREGTGTSVRMHLPVALP